MIIFTCFAVNYLPKARELCRSIKRFHPELRVHFVLVDRPPDWLSANKEPCDSIVSIEELEIPRLKAWTFKYSLVEMCTAVKPYAAKYFFDKHACEAVIYFDPDIVVFSRLDDLIEEIRDHSIVLTPHQTRPELTFEGIAGNEILSLRRGIYNLGFVAIRNDRQGREFVNWWGERVASFCWAEDSQGLWVDQKWVNFVPVFFEGVKILKESRFNVAPWNLATRSLEGSFEQGFSVDGRPLGFYHFTGIDSGDHEIAALKYGGKNAAVKRLISWYKQAGKADRRAVSTAWAFADPRFENGEPVTEAQRVTYKRRFDLQEAFPDPFKVADGASYYDWFRTHAAREHPEVVGRAATIGWRTVLRKLRRAIMDYRYGRQLCRRTRDIIRKEGWKGVMKRLTGG